jgi:hypothetical protein
VTKDPTFSYYVVSDMQLRMQFGDAYRAGISAFNGLDSETVNETVDRLMGHMPKLARPVEPTTLTREELAQRLTLAEAERDRAIDRRDHTVQWYAERLERLKDFAKEHGHWPEVACIIANGTASPNEPPTYAQQLNMAKHRAEAAEKKLAKAHATICSLLIAADEGPPEWETAAEAARKLVLPTTS